MSVEEIGGNILCTVTISHPMVSTHSSALGFVGDLPGKGTFQLDEPVSNEPPI